MQNQDLDSSTNLSEAQIYFVSDKEFSKPQADFFFGGGSGLLWMLFSVLLSGKTADFFMQRLMVLLSELMAQAANCKTIFEKGKIAY